MREGANRTDNENPNANENTIPFLYSLPLAFGLFGFWIVLSGKLDLFHLATGAVAALAVAFLSGRLFELSPPVASRGREPFLDLPWVKLLSYIPWLAWQITLSALSVAAIVLRPKMRLDPELFRFTHPLPNNVARATLANSITLTPGTVTLDVRQDEYLVHALTRDAAEALKGGAPGNMKERVSKLFAHAHADGPIEND